MGVGWDMRPQPTWLGASMDMSTFWHLCLWFRAGPHLSIRCRSQAPTHNIFTSETK